MYLPVTVTRYTVVDMWHIHISNILSKTLNSKSYPHTDGRSLIPYSSVPWVFVFVFTFTFCVTYLTWYRCVMVLVPLVFVLCVFGLVLRQPWSLMFSCCWSWSVTSNCYLCSYCLLFILVFVLFTLFRTDVHPWSHMFVPTVCLCLLKLSLFVTTLVWLVLFAFTSVVY